VSLDLNSLRLKYGLHSASSLDARVKKLGAGSYVIRSLLPSRSVGLVLGDSGLGKSPLMYQAGICVAAGIPFLGNPTAKGRVVIADYENGLGDMNELLHRISRFLGLPEPPENLFLWSLHDASTTFGKLGLTMTDLLREVRPMLAVIDSLSAFSPQGEEKNSSASGLMLELRGIARYGMSILLVHHRRKQSRKADESAGALESAHLQSWFQECRGASALINSSDIRLGVDVPDVASSSKDEVALVLRGFGRVRGEIGPFYLARDRDENGDPAGYRALSGAELLINPEQQSALAVLPPTFRFKQAKQAYRHGDQATTNFLVKCISLGLVDKLGRGNYQKVDPANTSANAGTASPIDSNAIATE
jgi:hypothetical protein